MWELWSDDTRVVVYSKYTTAEGVATGRKREYTYFYTYLSPPPYSTWTRSDWTQMLHETLQERVQQRKERPTDHKQNKKVPFQKQNNRTCENCDQMKLELLFIQTHHNERRGHREGEGIHLLSCIFVTAPVFHLDTSELNLDANRNTARERKQKDQPTTNNKKAQFQKHKTKQ